MLLVKGSTWWNAQVLKATQTIVCGRKVVSECAPVSTFPHSAPFAWQQTCKSSHDKTSKSSVFSWTVLTSKRQMPSTLECWRQFICGYCGPPWHCRDSQFWVLKQVHFLQRCSSKDSTFCLPYDKLLESLSPCRSHSLLPHILMTSILTKESTCQKDDLITANRYPVAKGYRQLCRRGMRCIHQFLGWILVQNQPGFNGSRRKHLPALQHSVQWTRHRLAELSC